MKHHLSKEVGGSIAILAATCCFYLAAVIVRWSVTRGLALNSTFFVFARYLFGFIVVLCIFLGKRRIPRPRQYHFVLGRALANLLMTFCFFKAVEVTTAAEANILNMTSPIFIAIFSWIFFKKQRDFTAFIMTFVAFCGILLVLAPGEIRIDGNNLWGLASGMMAAIAVIYLNLARQQNDTDTILLIVFGIGTILLYLVFHENFYMPSRVELGYLVSCALVGFIGLYLLTLGFRYVAPVKGGIISSARIPIAAILGPYITSDPALVWWGWIGALLILGTNIYFILRRSELSKASLTWP